jgi:hypothetical protein
MTAPATLPCCISGTLYCDHPSYHTFTCSLCRTEHCWCYGGHEDSHCNDCYSRAYRTILGIFFSQHPMARPKPKPKTARDLRFELIAAKHRIAELEEQNAALTESLRQSRADAKALATLTR